MVFSAYIQPAKKKGGGGRDPQSISVSLVKILCCSQTCNDPQEDLAKFGYKLNRKSKHPSIFLA
jgi:hypothetical protein